MSPQFNFSPDAVVASMEVLPKGEYEFKVGTPKSFLRQNSKGADSYGVRYPLTVVLPAEMEGKRVVFSTYFQSDGAQSMAKQFMMAVLGYGKGRTEEQRFNNDFRDKDFTFDPDDGSVGDAYTSLEGLRVIGSLDTQPNQNNPDEDMQQFKGWRSVASGPLR